MGILKIINWTIAIAFMLCYAYQGIYILIAWLKKEKKPPVPAARDRDYAVLICARNEAVVIGDLLDSLHRQTWPAKRLHIFVMADNCTDNTAQIAAAGGAEVYTRQNQELIGKGYALQELLSHIRADHPEGFDGYFVFDADNILEPDYIEQMDRTFCAGNDIITSYRNSKNYGDNWISSGYALWFLRESRYLNYARHLIGTSCAVSGTGFFFSRAVADEINDWPFHLLTEDIEFSIHEITKGRKVAFCRDAILYDEQPTRLSQSFRQRTRWCRGYLQVIRHYGGRLLTGMFHGDFSCYDMTMNIMPAFILSAVSIVLNVVLGIRNVVISQDLMLGAQTAWRLMQALYFVPFVMGAITTISEWRRINTSAGKKILYMFTFPLYMLTYIPVYVASLFKTPVWKPIVHSVTASQAGLLLEAAVQTPKSSRLFGITRPFRPETDSMHTVHSTGSSRKDSFLFEQPTTEFTGKKMPA